MTIYRRRAGRLEAAGIRVVSIAYGHSPAGESSLPSTARAPISILRMCRVRNSGGGAPGHPTRESYSSASILHSSAVSREPSLEFDFPIAGASQSATPRKRQSRRADAADLPGSATPAGAPGHPRQESYSPVSILHSSAVSRERASNGHAEQVLCWNKNKPELRAVDGPRPEPFRCAHQNGELRLRDHPVQFHGGGVRDEHRFPQRLCGNCAGKGGKCLRINSQTLFPVLCFGHFYCMTAA